MQYVRVTRGSRKGQPMGMVVAMVSDKAIGPFGWSKCHSGLDTYNKERGIQIACDRLAIMRTGKVKGDVYFSKTIKVPRDVVKTITSMKAAFKPRRKVVTLSRVVTGIKAGKVARQLTGGKITY
jgi:hypothetical protein